MADGEIEEERRRIQSGPGFDSVLGIRETGRIVEGTQSAKAWEAIASSDPGGVERSTVHTAWMVTKRELFIVARGGGVFEGSAVQAWEGDKNPSGSMRLGIF